MSTRTEVENIRTSGAEKVLAAVLAIFMLVGGVWIYGQIGKISEDTYRDDYGMMMRPAVSISAEDQAALKDQRQAENNLWNAKMEIRRAREELTFTGEAYRTEIDAGQTGKPALAEYRKAQRRLEQALASTKTARQNVALTKPAANQARENRSQAIDKALAEQRSDDRWVAILRVLLIAVWLVLSIYSLSVCRRKRSSLVPLSLAGIVSGASLAAWMALDYGTSLGVFREMGPILISVIGIALTTIAFLSLQRYLAKKIPARRVRKRECPFCGYPSRDNHHCEGCGRGVVAECSTCHHPRRVATPHCGSCGAA